MFIVLDKIIVYDFYGFYYIFNGIYNFFVFFEGMWFDIRWLFGLWGENRWGGEVGNEIRGIVLRELEKEVKV